MFSLIVPCETRPMAIRPVKAEKSREVICILRTPSLMGAGGMISIILSRSGVISVVGSFQSLLIQPCFEEPYKV